MPNLFPYQEEGANFLSSRTVALLADEMGLGKSAQAVRACDIVNAKRILILCPASARVNWQREFDRFSITARHFEILTKRGALPPAESSAIVSYDLAPYFPKTIAHERFDALILDECHYLKNPKAKRTRSVLGAKGLCHQAGRTWALSGTPMPNNPSELWVLLHTFGITELNYYQFVFRYCSYFESFHGPQITGTRTSMIPELRKLLSPIMKRRKKKDVVKDLPPISFQHMVVERSEVNLELESSFFRYVFPKDNTKELFQELNRQQELITKLVIENFGITAHVAKIGKVTAEACKALESLSGSVSTLRRYTGLQKVKAVSDMVNEELVFGAYEKVVIFGIHQCVIEGLRQALERWHPVTLYGNTPPEKRQRHIDRFQSDPKCRVFIGNIQAAGTAITLTAAHHVVMIEQSWVPAENAQSVMRCHRIGQVNPVFVRFIGLADSIDERVSEILRTKTMAITKIFDKDDVTFIPPMMGSLEG